MLCPALRIPALDPSISATWIHCLTLLSSLRIATPLSPSQAGCAFCCILIFYFYFGSIAPSADLSRAKRRSNHTTKPLTPSDVEEALFTVGRSVRLTADRQTGRLLQGWTGWVRDMCVCGRARVHIRYASARIEYHMHPTLASSWLPRLAWQGTA